VQSYEAPTISTLGTVRELTLGESGIDKCGGTGDAPFPQLLSNRFAEDCDA
jgi:hypothetical protein